MSNIVRTVASNLNVGNILNNKKIVHIIKRSKSRSVKVTFEDQTIETYTYDTEIDAQDGTNPIIE